MVIPVYYRAYIIICERFEALSYLTESGSIQSNMELKATSKARQTLTLPSFRPLLCPLLQLVKPPFYLFPISTAPIFIHQLGLYYNMKTNDAFLAKDSEPPSEPNPKKTRPGSRAHAKHHLQSLTKTDLACIPEDEHQYSKSWADRKKPPSDLKLKTTRNENSEHTTKKAQLTLAQTQLRTAGCGACLHAVRS